MAELEDRGKRTVICCQSLSAVCHCCFNQGRVSVGRLRLLFSRIREKETPAAGLAWRCYAGCSSLLWTFQRVLRGRSRRLTLSLRQRRSNLSANHQASALLSVVALRLCRFPSSSSAEPPVCPSSAQSPPVNQTLQPPWSGLHGGSTPAA